MAQYDDLTVRIGADIKTLQKELRRAQREAEIAGKGIADVLNKSGARTALDAISSGLSVAANGAVVLGAAAVTAAGGIAIFTKNAFDMAGELARVADRSGQSIERLQELQYAAGQNGAEFSEVTASIEKFVRTLGDVHAGSKTAEAGFAALGISKDMLANASAQQALEMVLAQLEKVPDAAQRGALAVDIFGKSGLAMAQVAQGGVGSIESLSNAARGLGLVLSSDTVRAADSAGDSIDRLQSVIRTGLQRAALEAAPKVEEFVNSLLADPTKLQNTIDQLVDAAGNIVKIGAAALKAAGAVAGFFQMIGEGLAIAASGANPFPYEEQIIDAEKSLGLLNNQLAIVKKQTPDVDMTPWLTQIDAAKQKIQDLIALQSQAFDDMARQAAARDGGGGASDKEGGSSSGSGPDVPAPGSGAVDPAIAAGIKAQRDEMVAISKESWELQQRMIADTEEYFAAHQQIVADGLLAESEARAEAYEGIREIVLTESEWRLEQESADFNARMEQLALLNEEEIAALGGQHAVREALERDHQERMLAIQRQALQSGYDFLLMIKDKEARTVADSWLSALQTGATFSKKLFEANKVFAIGDATIKAYQAASNALATAPWPYNYIAAAGALAQGFANVRSIQSTKFGGGGQGSSLAGGAGTAGTEGASGGGGGGGGPQIALTLTGNNFSADQVRALIDQINEQYADGYT